MVFPFAFFAGALSLLGGPSLPARWIVALVALLALCGWVLRTRTPAALAVCGAGCGFLFAGFHALSYLDDRWPARWADERVIALAVIDSIPAARESGWTFDALVEIETPATFQSTLRVRLMTRDASFRPGAGERWRLLLTLRPPQGRANPGAQDFERQLFRDRVHALGTVLPSRINRRIDAGHRPLTALRERISRHIDSQVVDRDAAALISALAVGDTGAVSREQWRIFNATGTTHLVAISGLHVTLFAVVSFMVARRIWRPVVWLPRETFAALVGIVAASAYATLAGLSVPTQRTLIMLGAWLLARSMARVTKPFQPLALALLAVLLLDPFAPLSAGFWLSFVAMAAIILVTSGRIIRRPVWKEALAVQVAVTVALLPFSLALFGSVSLIGPLVNILAIPAMSWVLVPTILLAVVLMPISTSAANAVLILAAWFHDAGWPWLAAAADVPWALIHASPPLWWYPIAIASIAMSFMPWPAMLRLAALVCSVPLAAAIEDPLRTGVAEVTVLDAGEGNAVVVRTANHVLVYGTGDSYGTNGRRAENVVLPFLRANGVRAIDMLILSSMSPAIGAGVTALMAEMPVRQTLVGDTTASDGVVPCAQAPHSWEWDGVRFELPPPTSGHACPLSIATTRGRALIPGDAEARLHVEAEHGRWTVVSGRRTRRSTAGNAPARREQNSTQVLRTADLGAIRFRIDTDRGLVGPEARRADRRTLWAASP